MSEEIQAALRRNDRIDFLGENGGDLMVEGLMDSAFAYAVPQIMRPGNRRDPRHIDGGISLLDMGLSIAGERSVQCWRGLGAGEVQAGAGAGEGMRRVRERAARHFRP